MKASSTPPRQGMDCLTFYTDGAANQLRAASGFVMYERDR